MTERKYMDAEDLDVLESSAVVSLSEACTCYTVGASCMCGSGLRKILRLASQARKVL